MQWYFIQMGGITNDKSAWNTNFCIDYRISGRHFWTSEMVCIHQREDIFIWDFDDTASSAIVSSPTKQCSPLFGCQSNFSIGELDWYRSNWDEKFAKWVKSSFCSTKDWDFNIHSQKKNFIEFLKNFIPQRTSPMEDSNDLEKWCPSIKLHKVVRSLPEEIQNKQTLFQWSQA